MPSLSMATGSLVSVSEYLSTGYRPDCDYVDGAVVERNLGEYDHARLQMAVSAYLQDSVADYLNFGVRYVWVIDPRTRKAWR
jgi:Uma2 family endonuclease